MDDLARNPHTPGILRRVINFLHRLEEGVVILLLLSMIALTCTQVALRAFFSSGISWADGLLRHMVLWSGLLGGAIATRQAKHINIDIASRLLPRRWLRWLRMVINLFSSLVCGGLTWAGILFVQNEMEFGGEATLLGIAHWKLSLIFPVVFGIISLRFLINGARAALGLPPPSAPIKSTVPLP
jgi:TRAP-type C4-dicarboxylate transport system permease small subunit